MPRLPVPGSDDGTWGDLLNEFLSVEHDSVGALKTGVGSTLGTHLTDYNNPHIVTKAQVGLGNVTNDAQLKVADLDTDTTLAANSATKIPSQSAVKAYVDGQSGGGAGGGPYFLVAASNSPTTVKNRADYTATGTNDHTTINTALTAAGMNGTVMLAAGSYATAGAISLTTGQTLKMHPRAVITRSGSGNGIEAIGSSGAHVTDVRIEGGRIFGPSVSGTQVQGSGVDLVWVDRGHVIGCYVSGFGSLGDDAAVEIIDTTDCEISGCELTNSKNGICTGAPGSTIIRDSGTRIIDNLCWSNFDDGIHPQRIAGALIVGNTCWGHPNGGSSDGAGIDMLGSEGCTVSGNTCFSNGRGIEVGNTANGSYPDKGVTIIGNTCRNNTDYGITLIGAMQDVRVIGNTVSGSTSSGIRCGTADSTVPVQDVTISNNEIHDNVGRGIDIFGYVTRPTATHNHLSGHSTADIQVRVSTGTPSEYVITHNRLQSTNKLTDSVGSTTAWIHPNHGVSTNPAVSSLAFVVDGGGAAVTAGDKGDLTIPFACTVTGWRITGDQTGSIAFTISRATYANFPTFTAISGTEKPTLSSAQKNEDLTLTTWTTSLAAGDVLRFTADATPATVQRVTVTLLYSRT